MIHDYTGGSAAAKTRKTYSANETNEMNNTHPNNQLFDNNWIDFCNSRDPRLHHYFEQGRVDAKWAWNIRFRAVEWVNGKKNQNYWAIVRIYSKWCGVLVDNLSVEKFAELVVALCPGLFNKDDAVNKLKYSIYDFEHKLSRPICKPFPNNFCGNLLTEIDELFSKPVIGYYHTISQTNSINQMLIDYLKKIVAIGPYTKIIEHPTYGNYTATIGIEQYISPLFYEKGQPTYTMAFQYVEEKVDDKIINMCIGQYLGDVDKLFIVSQQGFNRNVEEIAEKHKIGLIIINPDSKKDNVTCKLPRWEESQTVYNDYLRTLYGEQYFTETFIIYDEDRITNSLSEILRKHQIPILGNKSKRTPYLSKEEIEEKANELTAQKVKDYLLILEKCNSNDKIPVCDIDPFEIASQNGIKIERRDISESHQLAYFDFENNVLVTSKITEYEPRIRFSGGHELGHKYLHSDLDIDKIAKNATTLTVKSDGRQKFQDYTEYQANYFASCLLMPEPLIRRLFALFAEKHLGHRPQTPIKFPRTLEGQKDFMGIVRPLSKRLKVSVDAAHYRLIDLGLIKNKPF